MGAQRTLLSTCLDAVVRPVRALDSLGSQPRPVIQGFLALALVSAVYTVILGVFIWREHPPLAPCVLPIAPADLYRYQIWYQGPVFLFSTAATALVLLGLARLSGERAGLDVAFARVAFATTVPWALTAMVVELCVALLLAVRVLDSKSFLAWSGAPLFMTAYQSVAMVWMGALLTVAVRCTARSRWWTSALASLVLLVVYLAPVGLFIR